MDKWIILEKKMKRHNCLFGAVIFCVCILLCGCMPQKQYYRECDDESYLEIRCVYDVVEINTMEQLISVNKWNDNEALGKYEIITDNEKEILMSENNFQEYEKRFDSDERYVCLFEKEIKYLFLFSGGEKSYDDNYWLVVTFEAGDETVEELKQKLWFGEKKKDGSDDVVYYSALSDIHLNRISKEIYESYQVNQSVLNPF